MLNILVTHYTKLSDRKKHLEDVEFKKISFDVKIEYIEFHLGCRRKIP